MSAIHDLPILGGMHRTLPLSHVQTNLAELAKVVTSEQGRVTVTIDGQPAVVLVSVDELEALDEKVSELDASAPAFDSGEFDIQAHLQSLAIANSPHEAADQAFVDSVSVDWENE